MIAYNVLDDGRALVCPDCAADARQGGFRTRPHTVPDGMMECAYCHQTLREEKS